MKGEGIISYYNRLNGNTVRMETLKSFHKRIQAYLDSDGHGPLVKDIRGIFSRLTRFLKVNAGKYDIIERLELTPIKVKELPVWEQHRKKIEKQNRRMPKPIRDVMMSGMDEGMLCGLEHIQEDENIDDGLGGISDTAYKVITDKILELLNKDGLIWRKPWNERHGGRYFEGGDAPGLAHNHVTKHRYRGVNYYLNYLDFSRPAFFTFKQVTNLGGKVIAGEKAWPVVYFKYLYKNNKSGDLVDERIALDDDGKLKEGYSRVPGLFYYNVFNYAQCTGLKIKFKSAKPKPKTSKQIIESAEKILDEMPKRPPIRIGGNKAFYSPTEDYVQLVPLDQFEVDQQYYSVAFHELIHSTSHKSRVAREIGRRFGDKKYAFEELIAELGSSYLCGESGILYFTLNNSAAYIQNWLGGLKAEMEKDPKFFLQAASAAQRAADFMLAQGEYHDFKKSKPLKEPTMKVSKRAEKWVKLKAVAGVPKKRTKRKPVSASRRVREKARVVSSTKPSASRGKSSKLMSASMIAGLSFKVLDLGGEYQNDFGKLYNDSQLMIWGVPGSGKTVYTLKLAHYLAKDLGLKTLYVAKEELGRSAFTEKIQHFAIGDDNLVFVKNLDDANLDDFQAVFLDSVNAIGFTLEAYKEWSEKHPGILKVIVVQSTKDGDFRGGKDWEHEVDVAGEIVNRSMVIRKNRYDPGFQQKADRLRLDEEVKETVRKAEVRKIARERTQPTPAPPAPQPQAA